MTLVWLMRAAHWVRNPPSMGRVVLVGVVVAICLAIVGIERLGLWPEALTLDPKATRGPRLP